MKIDTLKNMSSFQIINTDEKTDQEIKQIRIQST